MPTLRSTTLLVLLLVPLCACSAPKFTPSTGERLERAGDEIMVAGQLFHTGAPVVLWFDPGGYDAYRVERRFARFEESGWDQIRDALPSPNRYSTRSASDPALLAQVRGGGWRLDQLREVVDQLVLHYDVSGTSRTCFRVLHDIRGLSVHFMLDLDGTIYQTLDVKERAWHATRANNRSVGIEIANIGAYGSPDAAPLLEWYKPGPRGTRVTVPDRLGDGGVRDQGYRAITARPQPVFGKINGTELYMYDLTDAQYASLIRLTATLHRVLPGIELDYPRALDGSVLPRTLSETEFRSFSGVLGHWHVQQNKIDPGPALDWDRVVEGARDLVGN